MSGFVEAIQKIADSATHSKGKFFFACQSKKLHFAFVVIACVTVLSKCIEGIKLSQYYKLALVYKNEVIIKKI